MPIRILLAPTMPDAMVDVARALVPTGFELIPAEPGTPAFHEALTEAEYYLGFARQGLGNEFFRSGQRLKLVQLVSAGYDRLDVEAARKAGVPVANNGGANAVPVAEHTILLILAVLKRLVWHHNNVVAGRWRVGNLAELGCYEAAGRRLGLVGFGNIGKKVARRARALEMDVRYFDIVRLGEDAEDALGVSFALLPELLRTSDVVSLHVPLNDRTRRMIGAAELALMRPTAVLINTCRGPVVDEDALHAALSSGRLAGAGLDVLLEEPPPAGHPLFGLPNVTLTPHTAGPTWENWTRAFRNGFANIEAVAAGRAPDWVIPELRGLVGR